MVYRTPKKHLLDCRADQLVEKCSGEPDDLLSPTNVASWLGVSAQWLEIGRSSGKYGPPYVLVAPRRIPYRREDVLTWLRERTRQSTSEYASHREVA
jgi:hypothetical protein